MHAGAGRRGGGFAALPARAREPRARARPEHPDTLSSVNNLALCMRVLGDAAGALPLYQRALDSCERVLGTEHPNTLTSVNNLALCMEALGDAAGALPLCRRALDGFDSLFGPVHPSSRTARANWDRLEREVAAAREQSASSNSRQRS